MSAESDLYASLNVAGVTALVSSRIYPDMLPEGAAYPAVVYARTGTDPIDSISSMHFGDFVTFAVSVWGKTRTQADAAADAVEAALRSAGHQVVGRDAGADDQTGLVASTINVTLLSV